jgi:hypothetical protein
MPREFLDVVARPNVEEFVASYSDLRLAFNAIAALDALAAHLYQHLKNIGHSDVVDVKDDSAYRASLAEHFIDFGLLRDVAKAQKHVQLDRHNPKVSRASSIQTEQLGYGEGPYGEGRFGSPPQVVVRTNSGEIRMVETLVRNCLEYFEQRLDHYSL